MSTKEDFLKILWSYRLYKPDHNFIDKYMDRYGFWNDHKIYDLPTYSERQLEDVMIERVKELGPTNILWSGGVDSTSIVCAYIKAKVPFHIICDNMGIHDGHNFYEWLINNGYNDIIIRFDNIKDSYKIPNMIHGFTADCQFSPDEYHKIQFLYGETFYDNLSQYGKEDQDRLYNQIIQFSKYFGKPINTNEDIIRLINFAGIYIHSRDNIYFVIWPNHKVVSFFDTPEFNNIAYTQYWHRNIFHDKPEMHRLICDVTDDERFMYMVYRYGSAFLYRYPYTKERYNEFNKIWQCKE